MAVPTPYTSTVRVPLPEEADIARVIGDGYDPDTTLHVVKMFAGTHDMYPALMGMVKAVFGASGIDARHREVIILRAASVLNCPYEWQANKQMAANAGLTEAEISSLAADGTVEGIDQEYTLLARATDELLKTGTLTDPTLRSLLDAFGDVGTRKYVTTIAWFSMLSLFLNGTRVPMETTDKIGSRTSPLS
ncbi:carboxymuconolactone decarboxylase [Streptomyces sp. L-9-10]|uniref:carboxymuconolactone decarboxylase family protein n=1 Tax=unclassified Streptomyces TaxID=2593676 RepID=UPI00101D9CBA|nr:carboxymuconolactone decarboxylase family protein [Streptomyces sp. L-9-10]RYJ27470.1 carboxymuconolactone decarboxylase [Streptomyces sp. L-9-10]